LTAWRTTTAIGRGLLRLGGCAEPVQPLDAAIRQVSDDLSMPKRPRNQFLSTRRHGPNLPCAGGVNAEVSGRKEHERYDPSRQRSISVSERFRDLRDRSGYTSTFT
jgi:hypothetical protein